jgi:hypothetical protein
VTVGERGGVVTGYSGVEARWELPDGTTRTGFVRAENGLKAGAEVPVWLGDTGRPTTPPMSTADAAVTGVLVAVTGWLVVVGLLALSCWALHHALDRRRYRAWETDWHRTEPDWHDRRR